MGREVQITAFGETKTLADWARDRRCKVSRTGLQKRLAELQWPPERAISQPSRVRRAGQQYTAFGESKTIWDWAKDPRCKVVPATLGSRMYQHGWDIERALATAARHRTSDMRYTAFGQTKLLTAWSKDRRCKVTIGTLYARVHQYGWAIERAISTPGVVGGSHPKHKAFGETKSLIGWSKDRRCKVSRSCFESRVRDGWDIKKALSTPKRQALFRAFGEEKSIKEWVKDKRCKVIRGVLTSRVYNYAWPFVEALTTPVLKSRKRGR